MVNSDKTAQVWSADAETRGVEQLAMILRGRLALRLERSVVVTTSVDTDVDVSLPQSEPPPPRWDQRYFALQAGVFALRAGHLEIARSRFQEARECLSYFQDGLGLVKLALAEAALAAKPDSAVPAELAQRIGATPPQAAWWQALADFAHQELCRPQWALWALDHALALGPPDTAADLRVKKLEFLLAANQAAEVLQQNAARWTAQAPIELQVLVSALVWLAAGQAADAQQQRAWAEQLMGSYLKIQEHEWLRLTVCGTRHTFSFYPDSALRIQTLALFLLIETGKSAETLAKLAALLGLPGPESAPAQISPSGEEDPDSD